VVHVAALFAGSRGTPLPTRDATPTSAPERAKAGPPLSPRHAASPNITSAFPIP
jgi:hypothetical protein